MSFTKMLELIHGPSHFKQIFPYTIYLIWGAVITAAEKAWVWGLVCGIFFVFDGVFLWVFLLVCLVGFLVGWFLDLVFWFFLL